MQILNWNKPVILSKQQEKRGIKKKKWHMRRSSMEKKYAKNNAQFRERTKEKINKYANVCKPKRWATWNPINKAILYVKRHITSKWKIKKNNMKEKTKSINCMIYICSWAHAAQEIGNVTQCCELEPWIKDTKQHIKRKLYYAFNELNYLFICSVFSHSFLSISFLPYLCWNFVVIIPQGLFFLAENDQKQCSLWNSLSTLVYFAVNIEYGDACKKNRDECNQFVSFIYKQQRITHVTLSFRSYFLCCHSYWLSLFKF